MDQEAQLELELYLQALCKAVGGLVGMIVTESTWVWGVAAGQGTAQAVALERLEQLKLDLAKSLEVKLKLKLGLLVHGLRLWHARRHGKVVLSQLMQGGSAALVSEVQLLFKIYSCEPPFC
ncbi:hypothetical protein VOLCADRAFT_92729 [Volvox carteri f. nagariensis]|uniref:Uncharacterized protein n=1 Tax=Volvox carteri f. nagariensis TaxID=3068 RepID=D8U0D5_VOLCA|nr:uncharacterized protein VOLCADRAFT_92729 [Volvox carteri f. nagariensis]EFJ46924.1 hypothetical protein VOLCADRAFT_92729 [Volvox carteri f. nagariensis]|eukprot:XP_002952133.1 hypothetical protein VOLCADRAFT_92729 [Volvox carteri f. nagariensis]